MQQLQPATAPAPEPADAAPSAPPVDKPAPAGKARLGVISLGLALGITWGGGMFLLGLAATLFDWGTPLVLILSSVYIGYAPSFVNSVAGAVWGFVDGFIGGALIAWLYNWFAHYRR